MVPRSGSLIVGQMRAQVMLAGPAIVENSLGQREIGGVVFFVLGLLFGLLLGLSKFLIGGIENSFCFLLLIPV